LLLILVHSRTPGCGKNVPKDLTLGQLHRRTFNVDDYKSVERAYGINVPSTYTKNAPHGLLFYFHGWGSDWWKEAIGLKYNKLGKENDIITVYPKGMDDYSGPGHRISEWTSFNCGFAGDSSVCTSRASEYEYDSCKELGMEGPCNCFTCYDDVLMTKTLIDLLSDEFCLDEKQMLITGESNGGIMTYYLMQQLPGYFTQWMPVFGLPLKGRGGFSDEMKNKKILHYHGRFDHEVPPDGGTSQDYWKYESLYDTIKELATVQGCVDAAGKPSRLPDPFSSLLPANPKHPEEDNIECWEYKQCAGRVAYCLYDGNHSTWPLEHMAEMAFWFFYGVEPTQNISRTIRSASHES